MNKTTLDKVLGIKNKVSDTYTEVTSNTNNLATLTYNSISNSIDNIMTLKNKVSVLSDMFTDLRVLNGTAKNIIYLSTLPVIENQGIKILNDKLELDTTSKKYKEVNVRTSSISSLEKYTLKTTDGKKTDIDSFLKSNTETIVTFPNTRYIFNLNLSYTSLEQINNIDIQLGLLTDSYPIINSIKYIDKDNIEQSVLILNNTSTSYDLDYNREENNLYSIEISPILTDQIIIEFTSKTKSSIMFKDIKTSFKKEVEQGNIILGPVHTNTPLLKLAIDTDDISTGSSFEFSSDLDFWIPLDSSSIITNETNTKILSFNTINSNSIKSTEDLYTFYIRVNITSSILTNSDANINIYNTIRENNSVSTDILDLVDDNLFSVYKVKNSDFIHGEYQYIESLNVKDFSLDIVEYLEVNGIPKVLGLIDTPYSITKNTTINNGGIGSELKYKRLPSANILESTEYDVANSKIFDIYLREIEEKINTREKDNLCFRLKRDKIKVAETKPPLPPLSCEGATDITGCIEIEGKWDLEIDGVLVLTDATTSDLETYLFTNEQLENSLAHHCGCDDYVRQINVPYSHYLNGDKLYLPVALQPNGQSVTSPFIVQGSTIGEIINFIADTLNSQLEPYGLHCVYGLFASTNIFLGVTDNRTTSNYKDTEFYILDEGNTFTKEQIPRGLPPYYCFMPT